MIQEVRLIPEYTAYENIALPVVLDNQDVDEEEINDLLDSIKNHRNLLSA